MAIFEKKLQKITRKVQREGVESMLIQFSVENFGPFAERATLSMVPVPAYKEYEENLMPTPHKAVPKLLRSALLFGPNASGKSQLLHAMRVMQMGVQNSYITPKGRNLLSSGFALDEERGKAPTEFEIIFVAGKDHQRYQYGFEIFEGRVHREWLYAWKPDTGRRRTIFVRDWDADLKDYVWEPVLGLKSSLSGFKDDWMDDVLENRLFLSVAGQKKSASELDPIMDWFTNKLIIIMDMEVQDQFVGKTIDLASNQAGKEWLLGWMNAADFSISELELKRISVDTNKKKFTEEITGITGEQSDELEQFEVKLFRKKNDGELVALLESRGTEAWFKTAGVWKEAMEHGQVVVVDELEKKLHTHLVELLLEKFRTCDSPTPPQLIATSHAYSLMDDAWMRRDQIWLLEKDRQQRAHLFPASDFKIRKGQSIAKLYRSGALGGVPNIVRTHRILGESGLGRTEASHD